MTKKEFIKKYCEKSGITKKELLKTQVVLPCNCNYEGCKGWAMVTKSKLAIKAHNEIYT